jgi:hypothetical protein
MVDPSVERSTRKYLRLIRDHGIAVRFGVVFGSQITLELKAGLHVRLLTSAYYRYMLMHIIEMKGA